VILAIQRIKIYFLRIGVIKNESSLPNTESGSENLMSEGTFKPDRKPKVIQLDCDKWWKVIGISLWFFASFGIYYGEYQMVVWSTHDKYSICLGNLQNDYETRTQGGNTFPVITGMSCHNWSIWSPLDIIGLIFGTGATLFNSIGIWIIINNHWKLLKVECKSRGSIT